MATKLKVAIGSDHGGYELKDEVIGFLKAEGYDVNDFGTHSRFHLTSSRLRLNNGGLPVYSSRFKLTIKVIRQAATRGKRGRSQGR